MEAFLELWPAWVAISISGLLAINRLIEESAKFAGYLGSWGRKRHEKAVKRHQLDLQASMFADAVQAAVEKAREQWEGEENQAIAALRTRLEEVSRIAGQQALELTQVRKTIDTMSAYAEYEVQWHKIVRGIVVSEDMSTITSSTFPPHMTWWTFERLYNDLGPGKDWWFAEDRDERPFPIQQPGTSTHAHGPSTGKRRGV